MVTPIVATNIPVFCPQIETAKTVPKAAAAVLTRLLPRSTVDKNLSGLSIILATRLALFTLVSTRCCTRNLSRETKAVSELEKKADKRRQIKRNTRYSVSIDILPHLTIFLYSYRKLLSNHHNTG
jgi:hypothetical protein